MVASHFTVTVFHAESASFQDYQNCIMDLTKVTVTAL